MTDSALIFDDVSDPLSAAPSGQGQLLSWDDTLESVRDSLFAERVVLQLKVGRRHPNVFFMARGVHTSVDEVSEWEDWIRGNQLDLKLRGERVRVFNDVREMSSRPEFLRMTGKYNVGASMSATLGVFGEDEFDFHVIRSASSSPFEKRDVSVFRVMVRHLASVVALHRALQSARVMCTAQGEVLGRVGIGALSVGQDRTVGFVNESAQHMADAADGFVLRRGQLFAVNPRDDRALVGALSDVRAALGAAGVSGVSPRILRIRRGTGKRDFAVVVRALPEGGGGAPKPPGSVAVFIRDPDSCRVSDSHVYRVLFDLTPMESCVAVQLANGLSLDQIQSRFSIKLPTLRSHIRSMFAKTGVRRQSDLVRVLITTGLL